MNQHCNFVCSYQEDQNNRVINNVVYVLYNACLQLRQNPERDIEICFLLRCLINIYLKAAGEWINDESENFRVCEKRWSIFTYNLDCRINKLCPIEGTRVR